MNPDEEKAACEAPEEVRVCQMQASPLICLVKLAVKIVFGCHSAAAPFTMLAVVSNRFRVYF